MNRQSGQKPTGGIMHSGMLYGLSLGLIFGTALGNGPMGLIIGMVIGILFDEFNKRKRSDK